MVTPGSCPSLYADSLPMAIAHVMSKHVILRRAGNRTLGPVEVLGAHHPVRVVQRVQRRRVGVVRPHRTDVQRSMDP